eukprot:13545-Heterococcus_DN1.PRE.1
MQSDAKCCSCVYDASTKPSMSAVRVFSRATTAYMYIVLRWCILHAQCAHARSCYKTGSVTTPCLHLRHCCTA